MTHKQGPRKDGCHGCLAPITFCGMGPEVLDLLWAIVDESVQGLIDWLLAIARSQWKVLKTWLGNSPSSFSNFFKRNKDAEKNIKKEIHKPQFIDIYIPVFCQE